MVTRLTALYDTKDLHGWWMEVLYGCTCVHDIDFHMDYCEYGECDCSGWVDEEYVQYYEG